MDELPPELDFFRYAKGGPSVKRKAPHGNERDYAKRTEDNSSGDEDKAQSPQGKKRKVEVDTPTIPKPSGQRVTSKGKNIPEPIESFQILKERYHCSSLILSNLEKNGWESPTGIQAHGIPMLMEVRYLLVTVPQMISNSMRSLETLPLFHLQGQGRPWHTFFRLSYYSVHLALPHLPVRPLQPKEAKVFERLC